MTREQLIDAIANVSHKTYVRQAAIAKHVVERLDELGAVSWDS
jgi:hypothetical protein